MAFINHKRISKLMCHATEQVVHDFCKDWLAKHHPNAKLKFVVGSGKATYQQQLNRNLHQIVFGAGMIKSMLQSQAHAANWTSGQEILNRGYFSGDLSLQNSLVHTCLHEYSHFIQVLKGGVKKGSIHNDVFYHILDRMYERNTNHVLKDFMMQYPEFSELQYETNTENASVVSSIRVGDRVRFEGRKKAQVWGRVTNLNKRTVSVDVDRDSWRIPYINILQVN